MKKIYVIKKYVVANSAEDAIAKERSYKVDDCYLEENTQREYLVDKARGTENYNIGFYKNER